MAILTTPDRSVRPVLPTGAELPWQAEIRGAIRESDQLCHRLGLSGELSPAGNAGEQQFPVFVPPSYLARIRPGDPTDPLLLQVLPRREEGLPVPGYTADPVGDLAATLEPGLLQKYAGRALLIATGSCAVHCRYCFRRHFPYEDTPPRESAWDAAVAAVTADPTITELILSGGDPLMLVDASLARLVAKFQALPQLTRLRIHTRLPVMIPRRVTDQLLQLLGNTPLMCVMVLHANHARELADDVAVACDQLRTAGVTLLNQAVLLRDVNDSVDAQRELSERLVALGVLPYYLHQLDRVAGGAHFEVPVERGREIIAELRRQLPGYLVPRYVQEQTGEPHKTVLA